MRELIRYVFLVLSVSAVLASCVGTDVAEPVQADSQTRSEMQPSVVFETQRPPYATRSLVDFSSSDNMSANFLRIDEDVESGVAQGSYLKTWGNDTKAGKINWGDAYLLESSSISSPDAEGKRTVYLNPIQTYNTRKTGDENNPVYTYYKTLMVSWYPQTCVLHKNSDGTTASITEFETYKDYVKPDAYSMSDDRKFSVRFTDLNGETDVMVSYAVEAKQWHAQKEADYRYPFGSSVSPSYDNPIRYKHYLSAIRLHAYAEGSAQDASMWGKIIGVLVMDQPESCEVELPSAIPTENPENSGLYVSEPGDAEFSGSVDFPIIKTPMFGNGDDEFVVTEDEPTLDGRKNKQLAAYLGYSLIRPGSDLRLAVHTDAGIYEVNIDEGDFRAGYVYDVYLNFQTVGNISALLLNDSRYTYFDLTTNNSFDYEGDVVEQIHTANCYIIHPGITYKDSENKERHYDGYVFLANVAGNGEGGVLSSFDRKTSVLSPKSADVLWESSQSLIYQVEYMYGYVRFKTQPPKIYTNGQWVDNPDYKEGNAVIAVFDAAGDVLWSWHIWITDNPGEVEITSGAQSVTFLDRNLGATSNAAGLESYGLYYQWGRKDPSMGPLEEEFLPHSTTTSTYFDTYAHELSSADVYSVMRPTVADGVRHPMYLILPVELSPYYQYDWLYDQKDNLWGYEPNTGVVQKTIYDPCPTGYRVPAEELNWLVASVSGSAGAQGVTFDGRLFFPYSGYKGVDRGMSSMTCGWKYVGKKADYMSGKVLPSGHRSRVYMSKDASWTEVGTEGQAQYPYNGGNVISDGANRRVAGSVRCVKAESLGTIQAGLSTDRKTFIKGETINLYISAATPSSDDKKFLIKKVLLEYSVDDGANWTTWHEHNPGNGAEDLGPNGTDAWLKKPEIPVSELVGDSNQKTYVTFRITVTNGFGLSVVKTYTVTYYPLAVSIKTSGVDLLNKPVYWYEPYAYTVTLTDVVGDATKVVIEGVEKPIAMGSENVIDMPAVYLDNEMNLQFMNESDEVILERAYALKYTSIQIDDAHYEATGGTNSDSSVSKSLADGYYIVFNNKDDVSRHLYVSANGQASLSRDSYSAYNVFQIVDLSDDSFSSYSNVKKAKLMHLASGQYLDRSNSSLTLTANKNNADYFYFCSDWGSEAGDNLDIISQGGYYLDSPNYNYLRLSTGGREHYKWYVQVVLNGPGSPVRED